MGHVVLAQDEVLERDVAIKVIRPQVRLFEDFQKCFLREARVMASVRHENVVSIYSFGTHDAAPYFVMEYIPGISLERWLKRHAPVETDVALGVLEQICRGVQAIHDAGAVHLDLKSGNVLVGPAFRLAVTDLGLTRRLDGTQGNDSPLLGGTPTHMAPELIVADERVARDWRRADIYSLGVMAFELLTGRLPFKSESATTTLLQQVSVCPPVPSEVRPGLSPSFDAPILAALAKDPKERPASASAFFQSLPSIRATVRAPEGTRILIADDDGTFRASARSMLTGAIPGAQVICVRDGNAAVEEMDRNPVSVLVLDLNMPGRNGVEVLAAIRGSGRIARPRVVVATAVGTVGDWKLLSKLDAEAFLVKPVTPVQLVRTVTRLLGLSESRPSMRPDS